MSDAESGRDANDPVPLDAAKGGRARAASLTPEERSEIAQRAAEARWGNLIPKATHVGVLTIVDEQIDCAVLENGKRVLTQESFLTAIGRSPKGKGGQGVISPDGLPPFLAADNIKPFVSNELKEATAPLVFRYSATGETRGKGIKRAYGYDALLLPMVCEVYLKARDAGKTTKQQEHIVTACDAIVRGLAMVGIVALVDEATGYQEVRDRLALQAILDRFLRKEFAAWAKRFPDEFYQQIFRLRGWEWRGMRVNRPQCVARYTKELVYARLAPGILEELEARNPVADNGNRQAKHHQWLTEDVGHPALAQHLYGVIGLMRVANSWEHLLNMIDKAYRKHGECVQLELFNPEP